MAVVAIIGAQWGDEGKAKIVDLLADQADIIARFQGGHNAGHTVYKGETKIIFHLVPAGILSEDKICVLGNGMVIDLKALLDEINALKQKGIKFDDRLRISDRAHIILPIYRALEQVTENMLGDNRIGTTLRGIGPAYYLKMARTGLRIADLYNSEQLKGRLAALYDSLSHTLGTAAINEATLLDDLYDELRNKGDQIEQFVCDTSLYINQEIDAGKRVLLEGAQGTLLDVDHGTFPFVTSSNSTIGGAATGLGIPPNKITKIIGIVKAYVTRVGGGPFPTEADPYHAELLRDTGAEYGSTTGRPRRCGWLDLVGLRYADRLNAFDYIIVTKLDVLDVIDRIKVCERYQCDNEQVEQFPASLDKLSRCQGIYHEFDGWKKSIKHVRTWSQLPGKVKSYLEFIEDSLGVRIAMVSNGPKQDQVIKREDLNIDLWS